MEDKGFVFEESPYPMPLDAWDRKYGLSTASKAENHGYSAPPEYATGSRESMQYPEDDDGRREFKSALTGTESPPVPLRAPDGSIMGHKTFAGGCIGESVQAIYGGMEEYKEFLELRQWVQRVAGIALLQAEEDSRFDSTEEGWAQCMEEAGYSFDSFREPMNRDWGSAGRPTQEEIATARRDVKCRKDSSLEEGLSEIEAEYQSARWLEGYENSVDRLDSLQEEVKERAQEVQE